MVNLIYGKLLQKQIFHLTFETRDEFVLHTSDQFTSDPNNNELYGVE